jgi:hypothetical protein
MKDNGLTRNMKRASLVAGAGAVVLAIALCGAAAQPDAIASAAGASDSSDGVAAASSALDEGGGQGLVAQHEALGQDISSLTEISYESCGTCHGTYEDIQAATEDMWEGIGQIPDANPHTAHATNALQCSDCHSLEGTQVNVCNQCHNFDSPDGWVDKDPTTTCYGVTNTTKPTFKTTMTTSEADSSAASE